MTSEQSQNNNKAMVAHRNNEPDVSADVTLDEIRRVEETVMQEAKDKMSQPWPAQVETHTEEKAGQAPIFSAYSGMDMLGMGIQRSFPNATCVGGPETDNAARRVFRRLHGFEQRRKTVN